MLAAGLLPLPPPPPLLRDDEEYDHDHEDGNGATVTTDFRPFSAWDSHVVSQMKRSVEGASRLVLSSSHLSDRSRRRHRWRNAVPPSNDNTHEYDDNDNNDQSTNTTNTTTSTTTTTNRKPPGVRTTKLC